MILYHGSNVTVREPKILKPNRELDFGDGFYTTTNRNQAVSFAKRMTRKRAAGVATVNVYEVDLDAAFASCSSIRFDEVSDAWLDFVCANREGTYSGQLVDLAFGPVANDDVYRTLYLYRGGEISREETMARLKVKKLFNQLVFKSERALAFAHFKCAEEIRE